MKGNAKECSNYCTIALISHASNMSKSSEQGFNRTRTMNFQMSKMVLEKAEEQDIKLTTSADHLLLKSKRVPEKHLFLFIDYAKAFDCVDHNKLWKIQTEMGIPDHLICLLRNLYAGQEATVRTGHGTTD